MLERLDLTARTALAGAGSAFLAVVFPRSIFPFGLPAVGEGGVVAPLPALPVKDVLEKVKILELRDLCKARGLHFHDRTTKEHELVALLEAWREVNEGGGGGGGGGGGEGDDVAAVQETAGRGAVRVFKLVDFLGSSERLAWAKASGCPWWGGAC